MNITTNEWLNAAGPRCENKRMVLCRFNDGWKEVGYWNGYYWCDQNMRRMNQTVGHYVTHFYIYEKDNDVNLP